MQQCHRRWSLATLRAMRAKPFDGFVIFKHAYFQLILWFNNRPAVCPDRHDPARYCAMLVRKTITVRESNKRAGACRPGQTAGLS